MFYGPGGFKEKNYGKNAKESADILIIGYEAPFLSKNNYL